MWRKKAHYKKSIQVIEKKMWDIEFLREKMKFQREDFRKEYDRILELCDAAERRLAEEKEKEDPDKTIVENLKKYKEKYKPDLEQLKQQLESIDSQIEGTGGINETLDGYRTVSGMLRQYRKKL